MESSLPPCIACTVTVDRSPAHHRAMEALEGTLGIHFLQEGPGRCTDLTLHHVSVGVVSDGVDMWGDFMTFLPFVHVNDLLRVDGQHLIGIHHHAEQARVRLRAEATNKSVGLLF